MRGTKGAKIDHASARSIAQPHIDSFNFMLNGGLQKAIDDLRPRIVRVPGQAPLKLWLSGYQLLAPSKGETDATDTNMYPAECRESGSSYKVRFHVQKTNGARGRTRRRVF